ncbi:MAG: NAD(P)-dependent oxidoreductase [Chloroflexota bacterium]
MKNQLNILFLPHPIKASMFKPWGEDVLAAIDNRHTVRVLDYNQPIAPQFDGIDVVIDHGGSAGTREMVDAATAARLWQILGTGIDHFDLDYWKTTGMPVANCPGTFSAVALAECAMMFILMLTRRYPVARAELDAGRLYEPMGLEMVGLKLGIVGFGASGIELARRAKPFGLEISAIDIREVDKDEQDEFGLAFVGKPDTLDKVVAESDILSVHLHLNAETHHIIDTRRLAMMKPAAFIINVARGALIDEEALATALVNGQLGGAGLDAFGQEPPDLSSPLFSLPNVIATPHIAGVTDGTSRKRARCAADNVERIAAGLEPLYRVDMD